MSKVTIKKYKEKNRLKSFVITLTDKTWKGDFYLTLEEAMEVFKLLKKELKTK